ncbi:hypothetical protein [Bacillus alkalicellulosilyticus]|uniref:hypothetical protein n=1 Tax=Alkalihalobacterium alkalicellulosilyticum TaxID=1912214 RepID=UPI0009973E1E|nr:hypothetical protein [Bacillus alkalicellulosilyticus]
MSNQKLLVLVISIIIFGGLLYSIELYYKYDNVDVENILAENQKMKETITSMEYEKKMLSNDTKSISKAINTTHRFINSGSYSLGKQYLIDDSDYIETTLHLGYHGVTWSWNNSELEIIDFSYEEKDKVIVTCSFTTTFEDGTAYNDNWSFELTKFDDWKISGIDLLE